MQADLLAQHADMRSALQLASTSSRQAAHRAQAPAPDTSLAAAVPAPPSHALQQAVSRMELAGLSQSSNALLQGASQYGGQLGASSWAAGGVSSSGSAAAPLRSQHQHQPVIIPPPPAVAGLNNHTTNSYLPLPPGAGAAYLNAHSTSEGVLGQGIGQAQQSPASIQPAWAMPSQRGSSGQGSVGTAAAGSTLGHYGSSSSGHGNGNGSALQAAVELVAQQSAAARAAVAAAGGRGPLPPSLALQGAAPPSQGHTQQQRGQQGQSLYVPTHAASVRRLQQQAQEEQQQLAAGSRPSSGDGRGLADDLGPQQQQQYQSEPVRAPRPLAGSYQRGPREGWTEAKVTGYLNAANSPSGRYGATHSPGGVVGIHAAGHGGGNSGGGGANGGSIRKAGSRSNKFALLKEDMQTLDHEIAQLEVSLKAAAKRVM